MVENPPPERRVDDARVSEIALTTHRIEGELKDRFHDLNVRVNVLETRMSQNDSAIARLHEGLTRLHESVDDTRAMLHRHFIEEARDRTKLFAGLVVIVGFQFVEDPLGALQALVRVVI